MSHGPSESQAARIGETCEWLGGSVKVGSRDETAPYAPAVVAEVDPRVVQEEVEIIRLALDCGCEHVQVGERSRFIAEEIRKALSEEELEKVHFTSLNPGSC